jgi:hypothetical protein
MTTRAKHCIGKLVFVSFNEVLIYQLINQYIAVMVAETVSIGILSLPSVVATLGLVPYAIHPKIACTQTNQATAPSSSL